VGAIVAAWVHAGLTRLAHEQTIAAGPASAAG
jgi:hypothetical protein